MHLYKTRFFVQPVFSQLYEQIDGVSTGSSMGPLLANIIMTQKKR